LNIDIGPDELLSAVSALVDAGWGYLAAITGLDPGVETDSLWILYHFAEGADVLTLKVIVPRDDAQVPTIRHLITLAGIFEQELSEVLGVTIVGAVDHGRLFLPDDWPDGVFPLRKDFEMA
jgi:Ni,Fe-hydrogenase III component G